LDDRDNKEPCIVTRPPSKPTSQSELGLRARGLAGMSVRELAKLMGFRVPPDLRGHKGFIGQLVEVALGASAGNDAAPDFPEQGVELKTLPVTHTGRPVESTYICLARLDGRESLRFAESHVAKKLARVLFVPVESSDAALGERRFGMPFCWEPGQEDQARLAADFEQLSGRVSLGEVEDVHGQEGEILQLRPKALNRDERTPGLSSGGWLVAVRPRAWYLRASFTAELIARAFGTRAAR